MKITLKQMDCELGDTVANTKSMLASIQYGASQGSDLIMLPEMCDTGYSLPVIKEKAQSWDGDDNTFVALKKEAKSNKINVLAGISERVGEKIYNTVVLINRDGELITKYRKTHPFTMKPVCEEKTVTPGDELVTAELEGVRVGLITCYEIRFPEIARKLTFEGAKILFVPSAFGMRVNHWKTLCAARAIENQVFVVAANRVGKDAGGSFCGSSVIYDPWGVVLGAASDAHDSYVNTELDLNRIDAIRDQLQVHNDIRPELYK